MSGAARCLGADVGVVGLPRLRTKRDLDEAALVLTLIDGSRRLTHRHHFLLKA